MKNGNFLHFIIVLFLFFSVSPQNIICGCRCCRVILWIIISIIFEYAHKKIRIKNVLHSTMEIFVCYYIFIFDHPCWGTRKVIVCRLTGVAVIFDLIYIYMLFISTYILNTYNVMPSLEILGNIIFAFFFNSWFIRM